MNLSIVFISILWTVIGILGIFQSKKSDRSGAFKTDLTGSWLLAIIAIGTLLIATFNVFVFSTLTASILVFLVSLLAYKAVVQPYMQSRKRKL